MWIRKTDSEIQQGKTDQKHITPGAMIVAFMLTYAILIVCYRLGYNKYIGLTYPIEWRLLLLKAHNIILFAIGLFVWIYFSEKLINRLFWKVWNRKNRIVCEKYQHEKNDDGRKWSDCLDKQDPIKELKRIEDSPAESEVADNAITKIGHQRKHKENKATFSTSYLKKNRKEIIASLPMSMLFLTENYLIKIEDVTYLEKKHDLKYISEMKIKRGIRRSAMLMAVGAGLFFLTFLKIYRTDYFIGSLGIGLVIIFAIMLRKDMTYYFLILTTKYGAARYRIEDSTKELISFLDQVKQKIRKLKSERAEVENNV